MCIYTHTHYMDRHKFQTWIQTVKKWFTLVSVWCLCSPTLPSNRHCIFPYLMFFSLCSDYAHGGKGVWEKAVHCGCIQALKGAMWRVGFLQPDCSLHNIYNWDLLVPISHGSFHSNNLCVFWLPTIKSHTICCPLMHWLILDKPWSGLAPVLPYLPFDLVNIRTLRFLGIF